jgi:hypothetical protein
MFSSGAQSVWVAFVALFVVSACAAEDGHPPIARATAEPPVIRENDGFQTQVTLDASTSADPLDDPDSSRPLDYEWTIIGDEFRFADGGETSQAPIVEFRGDRPATIELTVTDEDGMSSTVEFQMTLTVSP